MDLEITSYFIQISANYPLSFCPTLTKCFYESFFSMYTSENRHNQFFFLKNNNVTQWLCHPFLYLIPITLLFPLQPFWEHKKKSISNACAMSRDAGIYFKVKMKGKRKYISRFPMFSVQHVSDFYDKHKTTAHILYGSYTPLLSWKSGNCHKFNGRNEKKSFQKED